MKEERYLDLDVWRNQTGLNEGHLMALAERAMKVGPPKDGLLKSLTYLAGDAVVMLSEGVRRVVSSTVVVPGPLSVPVIERRDPSRLGETSWRLASDSPGRIGFKFPVIEQKADFPVAGLITIEPKVKAPAPDIPGYGADVEINLIQLGGIWVDPVKTAMNYSRGQLSSAQVRAMEEIPSVLFPTAVLTALTSPLFLTLAEALHQQSEKTANFLREKGLGHQVPFLERTKTAQMSGVVKDAVTGALAVLCRQVAGFQINSQVTAIDIDWPHQIEEAEQAATMARAEEIKGAVEARIVGMKTKETVKGVAEGLKEAGIDVNNLLTELIRIFQNR